MDARDVNWAKLVLYVAGVFASVPRRGQQAKGDCCLRGLMLDGRRKSVQAVAARLSDGNEQDLQQFVDQSTWRPYQYSGGSRSGCCRWSPRRSG
jgi:SRSO17 transposase